MFKKLFLAASVVLCLTACTEDYTNWLTPKQNEAVTPADVTFTATGAAQTIDMATYTAETVTIFTPNISTTNDVEVSQFVIDLVEGEKDYKLTTDANGSLPTADLVAAIKYLYGSAADEHTLSGYVTTTGTITGTTGTAEINLKTSEPVTFKAKLAPIAYKSYIHYVGTTNGWSVDEAGNMFSLQLADEDNGTYKGYCYCTQMDYGNTFRFLTDFGSWDYAIGADYVETYEGDIEAASSDNNFSATAGSGLYYVEYSLGGKYMKANKINTLTLIGSAINGDSSWSTDSDPLTWDAAKGAFTLTTTLTDGEFKIRANKSWDISWGYVAGQSVYATSDSGANISVAAGTYTIVFKPSCDGKATISVSPAEEED